MNRKLAQYLFLTFFPILSIIVWIVDKQVNRTGFFPEIFLTYIMQLLGLVGLSLMALNFILSTKFKFIEDLFKGYDKSYKIHRRVGEIAWVLIFLHPVVRTIAAFTGIETIIQHFVPGDLAMYNWGILAFWILTFLIFLTIVVNLPYHIWKMTHRFMIVPLLIATYHGFTNTYSPFLIPIVSVYILILASIGTLCYIYTEFLLVRLGKAFFYTVSKVNQMGNITEIYFKPLKRKMNFKPGQYVLMTFLDNKQLGRESHPYSISSGPDDEFIRVSAKSSGDYSSKLHLVKVGNLVRFVGPFGYFVLNESRDIQIWVAGGIGITPFLSMIKHLAVDPEKFSSKKIYFFYCTNNMEEATYMKEVDNLIVKLTNFKVIYHCSDEKGRINSKVIQEAVKNDYISSLIMLCGPLGMMQSLKQQFVADGKLEDDIVFEDFSFK